MAVLGPFGTISSLARGRAPFFLSLKNAVAYGKSSCQSVPRAQRSFHVPHECVTSVLACEMQPARISRVPKRSPARHLSETREIVGRLGPTLFGPVHELSSRYLLFDPRINSLQCSVVFPRQKARFQIRKPRRIRSSRKYHHCVVWLLIRFCSFPR